MQSNTSLDDTARNVGDAARDGVRAVGDTVGRVADRATELAREGSARMRSQIESASDRTLGYVRDEPLRAVLMAAAAGALVFALARMLAGRGRDSYRGYSGWR